MLRKREKKVAELAGDCRVAELRKSNFEGPQSQFRNFFQSAIPQLFWLSAIFRNCGGADYNCGCPPLIFKSHGKSKGPSHQLIFAWKSPIWFSRARIGRIMLDFGEKKLTLGPLKFRSKRLPIHFLSGSPSPMSSQSKFYSSLFDQ